MFESEPEPELNGRAMYQPRGKVLGGTSSINGMIYMRGSPLDYDGWRQSGCDGWAWDDVLPYFKKAEDQARGPDAYHGVGGPQTVSDPPAPHELADAFIAAGVQAGLPRNSDFNGATQEGVGYFQTTTRNKRRWSTAQGYLRPARGRTNLRIVTNAQVDRIIVENKVAVGIVLSTRAGVQCVAARREVILAAGAFGSPHLLMLSGIGPADHLTAMGVPVVHDLAPVGANLQDHFYLPMMFRCAKPITMNDVANSWLRQAWAGAQYLLLDKGPLTGTGLYAGLFARSDPALERPDLQINTNMWTVAERTRRGMRPHPFSGFTMSPVHLRPDCRGSVRLKSPLPRAQPEIRFNYLKTRHDVAAMIAGVRLVRKIAAQDAFKPYIVNEISPGTEIADDASLEASIRMLAYSNLHPVGSCRMGRDETCVVDPKLRVYGIAGLRVVDASIMPLIPAGNTNAPTIMIGEKAADMILAA
jgi:choline dehydrogenase